MRGAPTSCWRYSWGTGRISSSSARRCSCSVASTPTCTLVSAYSCVSSFRVAVALSGMPWMMNSQENIRPCCFLGLQIQNPTRRALLHLCQSGVLLILRKKMVSATSFLFVTVSPAGMHSPFAVLSVMNLVPCCFLAIRLCSLSPGKIVERGARVQETETPYPRLFVTKRKNLMALNCSHACHSCYRIPSPPLYAVDGSRTNAGIRG